MGQDILIFYIFKHHHALVERLSEEMYKRGLCVDVFNLNDFSIYKKSNAKSVKIISLLHFLSYRVPLFFKIFRKLFGASAIRKLLRNYSLIDFHYYSLGNTKWMMFCNSNSIKYDITLWGSDILRADEKSLLLRKKGFDSARRIKSTKLVLQKLTQAYDRLYDHKTFYADFGNVQFEYIDLIEDCSVRQIAMDNFKFPIDKTHITLGYNGSKHQNHDIMIRQISLLPEYLKSKIHIIIPLSYGCNQDYIDNIRSMACTSGIEFTLLTKYMGHQEIAALRRITDITVNIQDTDAFSCSLQEHIYSGNIMLLAEWLDYPELKDAGVYYIRVTKNSIMSSLAQVLQNLDIYKEYSNDNKTKMDDIISWKSMSLKWYKAYLD